MYTCQYGYDRITKKLVKAGANMDHKAGCLFNKYTSLELAKKNGYEDIVKIFEKNISLRKKE